MRVYLDLVKRAVNNRMPTGQGPQIRDEQGRPYGKAVHHNQRYSNITRPQFPTLVQHMTTQLEQMDLPQENGTAYEVVIAGFVTNTDRDVTVLFTTNSEHRAYKVYQQLLQHLNTPV